MIDVSAILNDFQSLVYIGDYDSARLYGNNLPKEAQAHPRIGLARVRACMLQGHMLAAQTAHQSIDIGNATAGERLILALEAASIHLLQEAKIREAVEMAQSAFDVATKSEVEPVLWAEAERVRVRIWLSASAYYEIPHEDARSEHQKLPELSEILSDGGWTDEAVSARLTYADNFHDTSQIIDELNDFATYAESVSRVDLAAEAHVKCAQRLFASKQPEHLIVAELESAEQLYQSISHRYGQVDIAVVQTKLAIEQSLATLADLELHLEAYHQLNNVRGITSLLLDLSTLSHQQGDISRAIHYRNQLFEFAESAGLGLLRDNVWLAQVDLLMRNNDYSTAIELAEAAIATNPPMFMIAGFSQLLASAHSFVDNREAALKYGRDAITRYEAIGAEDSASLAALKLASDIEQTRTETAWDEAQQLLSEWMRKDQERGDIATLINKMELAAQIDINRYYYSLVDPYNSHFLREAEEKISDAEAIARQITGLERVRRLGNLQQLRGQIYQATNDYEKIEACWRAARDLYEEAGMAMEVANCHYIIGAIRLNQSNQVFQPNFDEAETNFLIALEYYVAAGMRTQAADTRVMLAQLYVNAAAVAQQQFIEYLLEAAIAHLTDAESDYDTVRREFVSGSIFEQQSGKRKFIADSQKVYQLYLMIALNRDNPTNVWNWVQRAKARALTDTIGSGAIPPIRILDKLKADTQAFSILRQEREISSRISHAEAIERLQLREELANIHEAMRVNPTFADYLEFREGNVVTQDQLSQLLTDTSGKTRAGICVDWISINDQLWMLTNRPNEQPQIERLTLSMTDVMAFVQRFFSGAALRPTLRDDPELLDMMDPLIKPLARMSDPEDLLVFSPHSILHALPLHALHLEGEPLIARNPVVYNPSLSILRYCKSRRTIKADNAMSVALFGNPTGDRPAAGMLVHELGKMFDTTPFIGDAVNRGTFTEAIGNKAIIHFQGHAKHDQHEPLNSHLVLKDGQFSARDVFGLRDLNADLVTLAACESAANVIQPGDEPLGLIPAFLYSGANSVLAALWRVHKDSAVQLMREFYAILMGEDTIVDKAQALRQAILLLRKQEQYSTLYHWAPYILYGDWE